MAHRRAGRRDAEFTEIGRAVWAYYRRRAISQVSMAVKCGELPRLFTADIPCVDCGKPALVYDHRDYMRPLDVAPVCDACNHRRGPATLDMTEVIGHIRTALVLEIAEPERAE